MIGDYLPSLLVAAANAHAIAVVIGVRRATPASVLRRLANRCWISALALNVFLVFLFVWALREGFGRATDPSENATRVANAISQWMNCTAFALMGSVIPCVVSLLAPPEGIATLREPACHAGHGTPTFEPLTGRRRIPHAGPSRRACGPARRSGGSVAVPEMRLSRLSLLALAAPGGSPRPEARAQPAPAQPAPPSPAAPSATPIEMGLRYVLRSPGTKACPKERFFRDVVQGQLKGRDPFVTTASKTFILTVRRVARGYAATSELVDDAGRSLGTDDEVVDSDCTNFVETMGHIVALAFTPIPRPKAEPPAPPAPRAPAPTAPSPLPSPPSPQELPPPDRPPPAPPPRTPIAVRVEPRGDEASLATPCPGRVVRGRGGDLGLQIGAFSVSGQVRYVLPRDLGLSNRQPESLALIAGGPLVCWRLARDHRAGRVVPRSRRAARSRGLGTVARGIALGAVGPRLGFAFPFAGPRNRAASQRRAAQDDGAHSTTSRRAPCWSTRPP